MQNRHTVRLTKLEKAHRAQKLKFVPQIVCYDLGTGQRLVTPDPLAKQIWIGVSDEQEAQLVLQR